MTVLDIRFGKIYPLYWPVLRVPNSSCYLTSSSLVDLLGIVKPYEHALDNLRVCCSANIIFGRVI